MNMKLVRRYALAAGIVLSAAFCPGKLNAQLQMTLSGTPGSPIITATFSGSSTTTSGSGSVSGVGWTFLPSLFNPFAPQITGGDFGVFNFIGGSATISINGAPQNIAGVFLQDSSNSPTPGSERFGATGFSYSLSAGQVFQWTGTATFNVGGKGLTFSDFNPGTTGPIPMDLGGIMGQLTVVPEPSSVGLLLAAGLVGVVLCRRGKTPVGLS